MTDRLWLMDYHKAATHNKEALLRSDRIRCFYCLSFIPKHMVRHWRVGEWVDRDDSTGLCPFCGIDALIGDDSGLLLEDHIFQELHNYWFSPSEENLEPRP